MPDTTFLDWPFLDDAHRVLKRELDAWAERHAAALAAHGPDLDADCRALVQLLGAGGWLRMEDGALVLRQGPDEVARFSLSQEQP